MRARSRSISPNSSFRLLLLSVCWLVLSDSGVFTAITQLCLLSSIAKRHRAEPSCAAAGRLFSERAIISFSYALLVGVHPNGSTPPRRTCIGSNPSPPSGWIEDSHLQAVHHARHTKNTPAGQRRGKCRPRTPNKGATGARGQQKNC